MLTSEALDFVRQNRDVIERSALHVYCSALGFAIGGASLLGHHRDIHLCPKVLSKRRVCHDSKIASILEISPDGQLIATVTSDFAIELWESSTGEPFKHSFPGHKANITALAFSFDSRSVASGSKDGQLRLWSLATGLQIHSIEHDDAFTDMKFSPCGSHLFTISRDGKRVRGPVLHLWNIPSTAETQNLSVKFKFKESFTVATFSSDSSLIAAASKDGLFEIRSTSTGTLLSTGDACMRVSGIALSPDNGRLALSSGSHIELWDVKVSPLRISDMTITMITDKQPIAISSNGKYLIYGSTVWDIESNPVSLWSGFRLPPTLQRYMKGPGSLLSYANGWIHSAHPQGALLEVPSYRGVHPGTLWRAHGSKVVFSTESNELIIVDCSGLLS